MSMRNFPCPRCGVLMRRLYIQQGATTAEGRRTRKIIAVARGCLNCGYVKWNESK